MKRERLGYSAKSEIMQIRSGGGHSSYHRNASLVLSKDEAEAARKKRVEQTGLKNKCQKILETFKTLFVFKSKLIVVSLQKRLSLLRTMGKGAKLYRHSSHWVGSFETVYFGRGTELLAGN